MAETPAIWISDGRVLVTTAWLCDNLPTTRKSLTKWTQDGMLAKRTRGVWDLLDVLTYRGAIGKDGASGGVDGDDLAMRQRKLATEIALKEQQAKQAKFKNALNEGKYIERAEVERDLRRFFVTFRKSAMMLPRRVAGELTQSIGARESKMLEARLADIVRGALSEMSIDGIYDGSG